MLCESCGFFPAVLHVLFYDDKSTFEICGSCFTDLAKIIETFKVDCDVTRSIFAPEPVF